MELRAPNPEREAGEIGELFSKTFGDYWTRLDYCRDGYIQGAPYDWKASRVGVINGEIASHFGIWDLSMRVGTATVRVAGVGSVATVRRHRAKGLMTQTARASVDALGENGYDLSLLFGIRKFYRKFGYVTTFVDRTYVVGTRDVAPLDSPAKYESFNGDFAQPAEQYNEENREVTGTFVRPTYTTNRRQKRWGAYSFDGGYVVAGRDGEALSVADCAGPPPVVLDVVRQIATGALCARIEFVFTPPRSRIGEYLQTISHTTRTSFAADGGPMIKVVNLRSLMEKLAPELSRRLASSAMRTYCGKLAVAGDGEAVGISIDSGTIAGVERLDDGQADAAHTAIIAGEALGRLVIGDDDPSRICRQAGITVKGDALHMLPILFPDQEPSTVLWDRF
jgi:predicted N-acetyltransferase YhbS